MGLGRKEEDKPASSVSEGNMVRAYPYKVTHENQQGLGCSDLPTAISAVRTVGWWLLWVGITPALHQPNLQSRPATTSSINLQPK